MLPVCESESCLIVEAKRENIETFLKFYESSSHSQEPEKHTYTQ